MNLNTSECKRRMLNQTSLIKSKKKFRTHAYKTIKGNAKKNNQSP